jgi:hypothetical protein
VFLILADELFGGLVMEERDWYVNYGRYLDGWRRWEDATKYGFLCAGGGPRYSGGLHEIPLNHRVWAYLPKNEVPTRRNGYGGVGCVRGPAVRATDFHLPNGQTLGDILGRYANDTEYFDDPELAEWFLPIRWLDTVDEDHLFWEDGLFAHERVVLQPPGERWWRTLERLRTVFLNWTQCL